MLLKMLLALRLVISCIFFIISNFVLVTSFPFYFLKSSNVSFRFVYPFGLDMYNLQLCYGMIEMLVCMLESSLAFNLYFMFQFTITTWIMITLNKRFKTPVLKIFPHVIVRLRSRIQRCRCKLLRLCWPLQVFLSHGIATLTRANFLSRVFLTKCQYDWYLQGCFVPSIFAHEQFKAFYLITKWIGHYNIIYPQGTKFKFTPLLVGAHVKFRFSLGLCDGVT